MRAVRTICQDVTKSVGRTVNLPAERLFPIMAGDFLWTQTVINVLNVASWRGVWGLWEALFDVLFEGWPEYQKCIITFGPGFVLTLFMYLISPLVDLLLKDQSQICKVFFSRLFTIAAFTVQMLLWCSTWDFLELLEADWPYNQNIYYTLCYALSKCVLGYLQCFNTLSGVPASVERDWQQENYCTMSTLMQANDYSHHSLSVRVLWRLIDVFCSGVCDVLGILGWFGIYRLVVDNLPSAPQVDELTENLLPIAIGFGVIFLALEMQLLAVACIEGGREEGKRLMMRRAAHWVISSLGLLGSVLYWAGIWGVMDMYVLTAQNNLLTNDCEQAHFLSVTNVKSLTSIHEAHHQPLASLWVTAIFGILGMMVLGTSRSLHGGLSHDGREDESYPLQPYYWLAIDLPCTRKYDHLNEEQA